MSSSSKYFMLIFSDLDFDNPQFASFNSQPKLYDFLKSNNLNIFPSLVKLGCAFRNKAVIVFYFAPDCGVHIFLYKGVDYQKLIGYDTELMKTNREMFNNTFYFNILNNPGDYAIDYEFKKKIKFSD